MSFPYIAVFVGLLLAYMGYSIWAGLDPRYPIGAALVLLVATAIVDALGDTQTANTLAEYVFFLLGAGVLLLLIDHLREGRKRPESSSSLAPRAEGKATETPEQGKRTTDQTFDRLQKEPIPIVDASGRQHQDDEQNGDGQTEGD